MRRAAAVLVVLVGGLAAACGGDDAIEPVATSSCGKLVYEGEGEPDVIVVSDFPLRGFHASYTRVQVEAIEFVLRQREFRAGDVAVGYQSCNYAIGDELDGSLCRRNAQAYVATEDVVGVIGPWNSGCAELQIPIASRREAGPLAMISSTNTQLGLTRTAFARSLYPDGVRSYVRVVTHDQAQGAAVAHLGRRLGARRVAVIAQRGVDDAYVPQLTGSFGAAARALGIETRSFDWPLLTRYTELVASVAAARPDLVFLVGLPEQNGKTLIEDLRAVLGPKIPLVAPDSFAASDIARELGPVGEGLLVTSPGVPLDALPPAGRRFLREFGAATSTPGEPYVPETAQATEVLLDAIAHSDGTRAAVVEELFATKVENGILGSFSFDRFGDIDPAPVGVYRYEDGKIVVDSVVRAPLGTRE